MPERNVSWCTLDKARVTSKAALLRAWLEFAAGKIDEAVADVIAVLKLARDCGSSPLMGSLLVGGVKAEETNSRRQRLLQAVKAKR
jgi:hypothetical protein